MHGDWSGVCLEFGKGGRVGDAMCPQFLATGNPQAKVELVVETTSFFVRIMVRPNIFSPRYERHINVFCH